MTAKLAVLISFVGLSTIKQRSQIVNRQESDENVLCYHNKTALMLTMLHAHNIFNHLQKHNTDNIRAINYTAQSRHYMLHDKRY